MLALFELKVEDRQCVVRGEEGGEGGGEGEGGEGEREIMLLCEPK